MTTLRPDFRRPPPGRFGGIGGLFGGMGGRMGGYNPFMGGGFNPYQQQRNPFMGGGFNPYQQRMPFMGGGMGGFNPMMGRGFNPYMGGAFQGYDFNSPIGEAPADVEPTPPPSISDLYGGLDEEQKNAFLQQYGLGALPTTPDTPPIMGPPIGMEENGGPPPAPFDPGPGMRPGDDEYGIAPEIDVFNPRVPPRIDGIPPSYADWSLEELEGVKPPGVSDLPPNWQSRTQAEISASNAPYNRAQREIRKREQLKNSIERGSVANIPGFGEVFSLPSVSGTSRYVDASGNSIPKELTSEWGRGMHGELFIPKEYKTQRPPSKDPFGPGHPLFDPRGTSPIGPPPRLPSGCPSPEEHIQLANNDWILAGELKVGDEVITSKAPQKVTFAKTIEDSPRREVLFTEGDSIVTSPSHPYFVKDKGFVDVEDLKEGDAVGDLIVSEVKPFSDGPVIHISVDKAQTYMLRGGTEENPVPALSHNKSLPAPEDRIGWPPGEQVLPPPRPPTMPGPGTSPPSIGPISTPTMPPQPIRPMPVMPRPIPPEMPQPIPREMPQRVMDPMPMPRPVMPQPMPPKMPPPGLFPMPDIQPMLPTPPRGIRAIPRPGARRRPRGGGGGP